MKTFAIIIFSLSLVACVTQERRSNYRPQSTQLEDIEKKMRKNGAIIEESSDDNVYADESGNSSPVFYRSGDESQVVYRRPDVYGPSYQVRNASDNNSEDEEEGNRNWLGDDEGVREGENGFSESFEF